MCKCFPFSLLICLFVCCGFHGFLLFGYGARTRAQSVVGGREGAGAGGYWYGVIAIPWLL